MMDHEQDFRFNKQWHLLFKKNIGNLPMDALSLKKGKICALTIEPISSMIWSDPSDSL